MRGEGYVRALTLAAVLAASVSQADAKIPERDGDAPAALPRSVARDCDAAAIVPAADVESNVKRVVGQVVGLDDQEGKIVLNTRAGQIAFAASVDTMKQLDVGDVIVIELTPEPDTLTRATCP